MKLKLLNPDVLWGTHRNISTVTSLTVIGVIAYNMMPSTPVPQEKSGVSGAGHNVAVSSDVGLWSGQAGHHVPVAENYLGQLPYREEG